MDEEQTHRQEHLHAEAEVRKTLNQHFDNEVCRMQVLSDVLAGYVASCPDASMSLAAVRIVCEAYAVKVTDPLLMMTPAGRA